MRFYKNYSFTHLPDSYVKKTYIVIKDHHKQLAFLAFGGITMYYFTREYVRAINNLDYWKDRVKILFQRGD